MEDLNSKLNEILSNPQSMQQIQSMLQGLGMGDSNTQNNNPVPPAPAQPQPQQSMPDLSSLNSILGSLTSAPSPAPAPSPPVQNNILNGDMLATIARMGPILQQMQAEDDTTRLLRSLRPLLSQKRQKKLDEALKIMQIMKIMPLVRESGFLGNLLG